MHIGASSLCYKMPLVKYGYLATNLVCMYVCKHLHTFLYVSVHLYQVIW